MTDWPCACYLPLNKNSAAIWLEANPALALALLSDEEVEGLAEVAQKNAEIAGFRYPIDRSFDIATYLGFTVGIRVRSELLFYFNYDH